jgi:cell division protein FtsW (lipid II flippase)
LGLLIELLVMAAFGALGWMGGHAAVQHAVAKGAESGGTEIRTLAEIHATALRSGLYFAGGILALIIGRFVSARRGRVSIPSPVILPATCAALAFGFALQMGYGDPLHRTLWPGLEFAKGVALAGAVGALVLLLPRDPVALTGPLHAVLPALIVLVFVALALFGSGTELAEDTKINLGGFQPLELVKLAFVLFLGHSLGRRAVKLRHQRDKILGLYFPRKRLLIPAVLVFVVLFASFVLVNDLGPLLILSIVFLTLFYVVTRASGWVVTAIVVVAILVTVAVHVPAVAGSPKVALRMQMWLDPWTNAQPNGDQGGLSRWAIAAGFVHGQGLGYAPAWALPAGHTDLVIAHLTEELGFIGLLLYLVCLAGVAGQGLIVAALNRTPERVVTAVGLSILLVAQWLVIYSGTTQLLPLTGVPAPFLSFGKTSTVTFVLVAAMLARLAEDGRAREMTPELGELRRASLAVLTVVLALIAGGAVVGFQESVVLATATSTRGVITLLAPEPGYPNGRVTERYDPRLEAIAARIPRGYFVDRDGRLVAGTDENGKRTYPLGDAMGTLLGPPDPIVLRPTWMLERLLAAKVRGYPERDERHSVWLAREKEGGERLLFIIVGEDETPEDRTRAEQMAGGAPVRLLPLPAPDFRPLIPLLRAGGAGREEAIAKVAADVASRTAHLTIDARLQVAASEVMKRAAAKGKAAATVVLDANTGEVLARAQWPDFNPGDDSLRQRLEDPQFTTRDPKFTGIYGPWPDKTGFRGVYQGGSAAKLFTSVVAARAGVLGHGPACPLKAGPTFQCVHRDAQGPYFTKPGWYAPVHDISLDDPHGNIEFVRGLAVSCNVYFGQLGLQLGRDAFIKLVEDGLDMGFGRGWYDPGKAGSRDLALTAFGQHASMMSVSQAARIGGTIGGGGVNRRCPPSMELGAACEEKKLVDDPTLMIPVLSGMEQVVAAGTARGIATNPGLPPALRVYGKTGTADSIGIKEEVPWGVQLGVYDRPHSWFVAMAEPNDIPACQPTIAKRRIVVAVVIPRGGLGSLGAAPAAAEIINAAYKFGLFGAADLTPAVQASPSPGPGQPSASPTARPRPAPTPTPDATPVATPPPTPTPEATPPPAAPPPATPAPTPTPTPTPPPPPL